MNGIEGAPRTMPLGPASHSLLAGVPQELAESSVSRFLRDSAGSWTAEARFGQGGEGDQPA